MQKAQQKFSNNWKDDFGENMLSDLYDAILQKQNTKRERHAYPRYILICMSYTAKWDVQLFYGININPAYM